MPTPVPPPSRKQQAASSLLDHEETFFLMKPDATPHHTAILQAISDTGLQITMQSFTVTQAQAEVIVGYYPSVASATEAARLAHGSARRRSTAGGGQQGGPGADEGPEATATVANDSLSLESSRMTSASSFPTRRRQQHADKHNDIIEEIMKLTRRGGADVDSRNGVNAGLDTEALMESTKLPSFKGQQTASNQEGSGARGASQIGGGAAPRKPSSKNREQDRHDVARSHIQHLVANGTCLVLMVAGPNAVSAMTLLAGPEDPDDARFTAPRSLRARFGVDIVKNAVFAACSPTDALALIRLVFGLEGRRSEGGRRRNIVVHGGGAVDTATAGSGWMDTVAGSRRGDLRAALTLRPPDDMGAAFDADLDALEMEVATGGGGEDDGGGGGVLESIFDVREKRTHASAPRAHHDDSYHPSGGNAGADRRHSSEGGGARPAGRGGGGAGGNQASAELARVLAEERKRLMHQSKALRVRELDLLLREQELFRIATSTGTTSPTGSGRIGDFLSKSSSLSEGVGTTSMRQSPRSVMKQGDGVPPAYRTTSASALVNPKHSPDLPLTSFTGVVPAGPLVVKSDIDGLIDNPRRIGYLFHTLDHRHQGTISRDDFLLFYLRSPCLHVVGQADHVVYVQEMLERQGIPHEMGLEYFTVALMRLLRM